MADTDQQELTLLPPLRSLDWSEAALTSVGVCGAHHNHRGADTSRLPQAQAVVLLLGKHGGLIIGIVNINDHLQRKDMCHINIFVNYSYFLGGALFCNSYVIVPTL